MTESNIPLDAFPPRVRRVYLAHALTSVGTNLLIPSFFFFAKQIFHWNSHDCLMLVSAEGVVYVIGALLAQRLAHATGRRRGLLLIQSLLTLLAGIAWLHPSPGLVVAILLAYTCVSAAGWPMFESLISDGADPELLSRRIGMYNLIWSGVGAASLAVSGTIINHFQGGMFFVPMALHFIAAILCAGIVPSQSGFAVAAHASPEPALLRQRRIALLLSRIGLPASYTVLYSLVALMPSLRVIQSFSPANQTIAASVWMATRFLAFVVLGATDWWHTRPRAILIAVAVMLISFLGVTLPLSDLTSAGALLDRLSMLIWQIPLGLTMGLIYAASLYFGMVLSEGSTEHGGYHEALIGVGQVAGPAAALAAQSLFPGDAHVAVAAVGGLLCVSLLAAGGVTLAAQGESSELPRPQIPA
jgi:MFS family permease